MVCKYVIDKAASQLRELSFIWDLDGAYVFAP